MHFRTRKRVVQVVRTTYDAVNKKPKAQVLGSINRLKPEISDELRLTCKPQELVELKAFMKNLQQLGKLEQEMAARTLVDQMRMAGEWLDAVQASPDNEVLAVEIGRQMLVLRRKLVRLTKPT